MRPPEADVRTQTVEIYAAEQLEPVAVLHPAIRVRERAPRLLRVPDFVRISAIRGEPLREEAIVEAVEAARAPHYVRCLTINPAGFLEATLDHVDERPASDLDNVFRIYHFKLAWPTDAGEPSEAGQRADLRSGDALLETSNERRRIPIDVTSIDAVSLVPDSLRFRRDADKPFSPKRVIAISRGEATAGPARVKHFDGSLLEVRPVKVGAGKFPAFEVAPKPDALASAATFVTFELGGTELQLTVNIDGTNDAAGTE